MISGPRIAVIGNAGAGKSTLARRLSQDLQLPHVELDKLLWRPDWTPVPPALYEADHTRFVEGETWIIDGLGHMESIPKRLRRATAIVLIDMPVWMHFWLAAERQAAWNQGKIEHPPGGASGPPPTEVLFRTIFEIDKDWMPMIRKMVDRERQNGKCVIDIEDVDDLRRGVTSHRIEPKVSAG